MDHKTRTALAAAMHDRHGVATTRTAEQLGISSSALSRAVARGELERIRQRVHRSPALGGDFHAEMAADLAACWAPAWAAYGGAMELHDLRVWGRPNRRELVVVGTARPTVSSEVIVHRTTGLPECDHTVVDDIPATTAERTMVDVAGRLSVSQRLMLLDDAIMAGTIERALMYERACALQCGRKGVQTLIAATEPGAEARFKSRLEAVALPLLVKAGVRDPQVNVVPRHAPDAGSTDVVSELDMVIVDWDGLRFHAGRKARQRDNEKSNAAVLGGYAPLRFTWYDVHHREDHVIRTTAKACHRRRG